MPFAVVEMHNNKCIGCHPCQNKDEAEETLKSIVSEYGVEPYDELVQEGLFEAEDDYTVQIVASEVADQFVPSLESVFPYSYQGGGYFRMNGMKKGEVAPILHGEQVIEVLFTNTILALYGFKPVSCKQYQEDATIAYDEGEPKGQCICGSKWYEHSDLALPPHELTNLNALMSIRLFQMSQHDKREIES